jgi:nucleoid-associated protein YgaU
VNLASLEASFDAHRMPILAAAGAGVAVLALAKKKKGKTSDAAAGGMAMVDPTTGLMLPYSAGGQTSSMGGAYDSSASDLYGAIQPQMESLGNNQQNLKDAVSQLTDKLNTLSQTPPPTPVPAPVAAPAPAPAPQYVAPAPSYAVDQWYTVRPGDNLSAIAARFPQQSITAGSIYNANRGTIGGNINLIRPGQVLHIFGS